MTTFFKPSMLILIITIIMSGTLLAQPGKNKQRTPPEAALNACADLVESDACSFTSKRDKELSGSCRVSSSDELACLPEGLKRTSKKNRKANRQEFREAATTACAGLAIEDSCSVTSPDGEERFGVCQTGKKEDILCRVERPARQTDRDNSDT